MLFRSSLATPFHLFQLLVIALVAVIAGCGGGGGGGNSTEQLTVSVSYTDSAQLLRPMVINATTTGFNGHAPNCSLKSGQLPPGMTLNSDCSITGAPVAVGAFSFVVHVGAAGVVNTLDFNGGVSVFGPSVLYHLTDSTGIESVSTDFHVNQALDEGPLNAIFWNPGPATFVQYALSTGELPPGVTLDALSGHLVGTPTTAGTYIFKLVAFVAENGQSVTLRQDVGYQMTILPALPG